MANYITVVSFIISQPFKKFRGNSSLFSSRNLSSSFLEVDTGGPKATTVALFHSNSCSNGGQKLYNRRRSVFDKITNRDDAFKLFHEMANWQPLPSVARFTKLLQAVTKTGDYSCSVDLFQRINALGVPPDSHTISIVIKCLCKMHRPMEGFAVLGYAYKCGVVPNVLVLYTIIIKGLCKIGLNDAAIDLLNLMGERYYKTNMVAYETIIDSLCKDEQTVDKALKLFIEMVFQKGMKPDVVTYSTLLYSLCNLSCEVDISNLNIELEDMSSLCAMDLNRIRNIFVHVYSKLRRMKDAERVVKLMLYPGPDTYKALIDVYCSVGEVSKARHYFDLLRSSGMYAYVETYNTLLKAYFKDPLAFYYIKEAFCLFDDMSKHGAGPSLATYHIMLEGLFEVGRWSRGLKLFSKMLVNSKHRIRPNSITYNIVLRGLCDNIKLEEALSVFHLITNNNNSNLKKLESEVALCSILIHRATNSRKLDTARNLFNELTNKGLQPDGNTYSLMIAGFCVEGLIEEAKQLFLEMKEKGFRPDKLSCYLLFRGLPKIQQLDIADKVIQEMEGRGFPLDEQTKVLIYDGKDG